MQKNAQNKAVQNKAVQNKAVQNKAVQNKAVQIKAVQQKDLQAKNAQNKDEKEIVKRNVKDSVFSDFFGRKENLIKLYRILHPEDKATREEDLLDITIDNVLVDDIYNDLGFRVGSLLIILVEAQSTWSINIIIRIFLYLASTYKKYIDENELDLYSRSRIEIPRPELYVIYTGNRKARPKEICFSKEFFPGEDIALEIKVKVLYGSNEDDVISQYVTFTKIFDEQRKIHGRVRDAIIAAINICKDNNVLKEYLESREQEVIDMSMFLFDDEWINKNHDAQLTREVTERVTKRVTKKVTKKVTNQFIKDAVIRIVTSYKKDNKSIADAIENVILCLGIEEKEATELVNIYW